MIKSIFCLILAFGLFMLTGCSGGDSLPSVYTPYDSQKLAERDNTTLATETSVLGITVRFPSNVFDSYSTHQVKVRFPYPSAWLVELDKDETYSVLRTDKEKYEVWYNITEKEENAPVLAVARVNDIITILFYENEKLVGERDYKITQEDIDLGSLNISIYVL